MMKKRMILLVLGLMPVLSFGQELARRAFFGVMMETLTDDARKLTGFKDEHGVLVTKVVPHSTAEAAGFQKGDVLIELGGKPVSKPNDGVDAMRQYREGEEVSYKIFRKGKTIAKTTVVKGLMRENFKGIETTYSSIVSGKNQLRTIISRPKNKNGNLPAVLFVQGVGCYSMDTPMDTTRSEYQLLNTLVRNGYTVMRVDKPGQGDSKGIPCDELDFDTELQVYKDAFTALQKEKGVDASNIFIIGHSMGGVMAPLMTSDLKIKGIIAYGTIGVNFMEYFANSRRNIAKAYGLNTTQTDDFVKFHCECANLIITAKMTREEVAKKNKECAEMYDDYLFRAKDFWYQLYGKNLPDAWARYDGKVLAAWGGTDYISTREEHEYIAKVVNENHPGNGTFVEVPNSSHGFSYAQSYEEAQKEEGKRYNPEGARIFLQWLNEQSKAPKAIVPKKD